MAPSISAISPATGLTRGRTFVLITGAGFDTQAVGEGDTAKVEVTFGGEDAVDIRVETAARLTCITPANAARAVDVVVTNIGPPEESATEASGYTYAMPDLTAKTNIQRVVEAVLLWWRRDLLKNTIRMTHTEYDATTGDLRNIVEHAKLPAVVLVGPTLDADDVYGVTSTESFQDDEDAPVSFTSHRPPRRRDLIFVVELHSRGDAELFSLIHHATALLEHTDELLVAAPSDPGSSVVAYQLDILDDFDAGAGGPLVSNVRSASGRFVVRGVTFSDEETLASGPVIQEVEDSLVISTTELE